LEAIDPLTSSAAADLILLAAKWSYGQPMAALSGKMPRLPQRGSAMFSFSMPRSAGRRLQHLQGGRWAPKLNKALW
jgi:hypothetical protein